MHEAIRSVDGVCEVEYLRGSDADPAAPPDLLLEVPHGATRARHFVDLWGRLVGDVATDLIDFFFVNTDVGAPELARAIAAAVVDARPQRSAVVVRSLLPRTLVDCNRSLAADVAPATSEPGQLTPGLPVWIRDPKDQQLLLRLHGEYVRTAAAAFEWVCGAGGQALMVHTYAPRNLDVAVDERIVEQLRAAYAPGRVEQWSLRPEIDLITHDPDGVGLAAEGLRFSVEGLRAHQPRGVPGTSCLRPASNPRERLQQSRACLYGFECRTRRGGEREVAVAALAAAAAELRRGAALLQHLPRRASCRHRGEPRR